MENYYRNNGFFHRPDQGMFYPVQSAYGSPISFESGPPGYDVGDFAFPRPTRYYYDCLAEGMYNHENLQWLGSHVQEEFDQGPNILARFSFAAEDETAILDFDGERNYSLANRLQEADQLLNIGSPISSDQGPNIPSRFSFAAEDETAILGLDGEGNYSLANRLQEANQLLNISSRIRFTPEEGTGILDVAPADGFPASFSNLIPVDDLIVALQLVQEDRMNNNITGLSEATILEHLKIRNYPALANQLVQEPEICVVCQCEYENGETIGILECRHEYHADCIKRWLMKKNVCPVCKREGIQQKTN